MKNVSNGCEIKIKGEGREFMRDTKRERERECNAGMDEWECKKVSQQESDTT